MARSSSRGARAPQIAEVATLTEAIKLLEHVRDEKAAKLGTQELGVYLLERDPDKPFSVMEVYDAATALGWKPPLGGQTPWKTFGAHLYKEAKLADARVEKVGPDRFQAKVSA
jgi:hypothetical protein